MQMYNHKRYYSIGKKTSLGSLFLDVNMHKNHTKYTKYHEKKQTNHFDEVLFFSKIKPCKKANFPRFTFLGNDGYFICPIS